VLGSCSPSQVGAFCECFTPCRSTSTDSACFANGVQVGCLCGDGCDHGYFCHTPNDTCLDDSDCGSAGACNYDSVAKHWSCSVCRSPL
jgi:hypothetical protein